MRSTVIIPKSINTPKSAVASNDLVTGTEVSVLAFCNGKEAYLMPEAQDYKRIYDGDKGPNTGGMGAICPANILTKEELIKVKNHMDKVCLLYTSPSPRD